MEKKTHPKTSRGVADKFAQKIQTTFLDFGVELKSVDVIEGFRNDYFTFETVKPVRMKTVKSFEDDLRYALGNSKIEIQAPIPDEVLIGVTVPKKGALPTVSYADLVTSHEYQNYQGALPVPLGIDDYGNTLIFDIAKFPHLLIGGATGSGKSNLLHVIITTLVKKYEADTVRFILVDPARVSLGIYNGLPHLLTDVLTDSKRALLALKWCVKEMERRSEILAQNFVADIDQYHKEVVDTYHGNSDATPEQLPRIVVIFDELADLMATYQKELEASLVRLMQACRSVGIHVIISTQRPSVNIITGLLKTNIPVRMAFSVTSVYDSRTILDMTGAEKLSGHGDALFFMPDFPAPRRLQIPLIRQSDVKANIKRYKGVVHTESSIDFDQNNTDSFFAQWEDDGTDELYEEAKEFVVKAGKASTSYIQRRLRIGYSRAARLMDLLEEDGVIGPQKGAEPREVFKE